MGSGMKQLYVIAGNYEQFRSWRREDWETRKDAQYVFNAHQIYGARGKLIRIGTWWEQPAEFLEGVEALVIGPDSTL